MLFYLFEQYIYVFLYLQPKEINRLLNVNKKSRNIIPDSVWYMIFKLNHTHESILTYSNYITIIYNENHKRTIDKKINTRNKNIYQYLCLTEST